MINYQFYCNKIQPAAYTLEKRIMTAILTKSELAEILLIDELNYNNIYQAIDYLKENYEGMISRVFCKADAFFVRAFRNRGYDIKLLISSNNSKFLIS